MYRQALLDACERARLPVVRAPAKGLYENAAGALRLGAAELKKRLDALGKQAGRPWAADQKESAVAAWLALARPPRQ